MTIRLLNRRQVAELLTVSERTVPRLVEKGDLPPPIHIGRAVRWREADVAEAIHRLTQATATANRLAGSP